MKQSLILGLLVALLGTGCYTMLRHPEVGETEVREVSSARCVACHSDWELEAMEYGFHHRLNDYYRYGRWWDQYYLEPWWYGDASPSPPVRGGQRRRQGEAVGVEPARAPRRGSVPGRSQPPPKPPKARAGERQAEEAESPSTPSGPESSPESKDTTPKRKDQGKSIQTPPPRPRP